MYLRKTTGLWLAQRAFCDVGCTSPNIILKSPKNFTDLLQYFCYLNLLKKFSKKFTCLLGEWRTESTGPMAESTSPKLHMYHTRLSLHAALLFTIIYIYIHAVLKYFERSVLMISALDHGLLSPGSTTTRFMLCRSFVCLHVHV